MYTIAVDFDGTLCEHMYPLIGEPIQEHIDFIIAVQKKWRYKIILWTCREGKLLDDAVQWCKERGLTFDAVNDNLDYVKRNFGNPRKVLADIYFDDKAFSEV